MSKRYALLVAAVLAVVVSAWLVGCTPNVDSSSSSPTTATDQTAAQPSDVATPATGAPQQLPPGLKIKDEKVGTGAAAKSGDNVTVNYTGWLTNGTKFDSSLDRKQPFTFQIDGGQVIRGWDMGVAGMKVGGKRKLTIPPDLGYGPQANGPIPANSTLVFEVQLLKIN